jgi:hypothetical protein
VSVPAVPKFSPCNISLAFVKFHGARVQRSVVPGREQVNEQTATRIEPPQRGPVFLMPVKLLCPLVGKETLRRGPQYPRLSVPAPQRGTEELVADRGYSPRVLAIGFRCLRPRGVPAAQPFKAVFGGLVQSDVAARQQAFGGVLDDADLGWLPIRGLGWAFHVHGHVLFYSSLMTLRVMVLASLSRRQK